MRVHGDLTEAGLERQSSAPSAFVGRIYINTTDNEVKVYKSGQWDTLVSGQTPIDLSTPTDGDYMVYNASSGKWEALTVTFSSSLPGISASTTGKYLSNDGTNASWTDFSEQPMVNDVDMGGYDLTNVNEVDGVDVSQLSLDFQSHEDGTASKHDATEIDYERVDGSKVDIQAASDDLESALTDLDDNKVSASGQNNATQIYLDANGSIDADAAHDIYIGDTNANTVYIGRSGQETVIVGDLRVDGTTTTVNTATLDVTDANITVNNGGDQATADANDAGLTVEMSDATDALLHYDSTATSKWKLGESGSTYEISTLGHAQTFAALKTFDKELELKEQTTPSNPSASYYKMYPKSDGKLYLLNSAGEEVAIGTGTGSGGVNYTTNPRFEVNTDNWAVSDGAGSSGDGTLSRETTTHIEGDGSLKITNTYSTTRFVVDGDIDAIDDIDVGRLLGIYGTIDCPDTITEGDYTYELYNSTDGQTVSGTSTDLKPGRNYLQGHFTPKDGKTYKHRITDVSGSNGDEIIADRFEITPNKVGSGQPERIAASYQTSAGQAIPNSTQTVIDFETKIFDDGSSSDNVTTGSSWVFTAPRSGKYQVNVGLLFAGTTAWEEHEEINLTFLKNGSSHLRNRFIGVDTSSTSGGNGVSSSSVVDLAEGDTLAIAVTQSSGASQNLNTASEFNYVSITEVSTPAPINRLDRGVTTSNARLIAYDSATSVTTSVTDIEWTTLDKGELTSSIEYVIEDDGDYEIHAGCHGLTNIDFFGILLDTGGGYSTIAQGFNTTDKLAIVFAARSLSKGDKVKIQGRVSSGSDTIATGHFLVKRIADQSAIAPVGFGTSEEAGTSGRYLLPRYQKATVTLSNSGAENMNGTLECVRIGNTVTITSAGAITHDNDDQPSSAVGEIPSDFRPSTEIKDIKLSDGGRFVQFNIKSNGGVQIVYWSNSSTLSAQTTSTDSLSVSYVIT